MLARKSRTKYYSVRIAPKKKPNLDKVVGYATACLLFFYIGCYSYTKTGGFVWSDFNWNYLLIIIPIWVVDGFKTLFESFLRRNYRSSKEELDKVTVIIACKNGQDVIEQTLKSLLKRFKPQQILVVSNGSTDHTVLICQHYGVKVLDIAESIGKVRAINRGLNYVTTPYVLLLDDDTLVGRAKIPTGLLDQGYNGVAFRVLVQTSNWLSKIQLYEYRKSTDLGKKYHNKKASVQNISGAIGLFTVQELKKQIRRHSGEFSGEDLQRTLLIHLTRHTKGVVLTNSTVYTQPPTKLKTLFDQRAFGWYPGLYANLSNYFKVMTRDCMPLALRFDAFYNLFLVMLLDVFRLLSLPILALYPWYFIITFLVYGILEHSSYLKSKLKDPYWVVITYPLYGLFGFITRISALATFVYRRLVTFMAHKRFLDDYRSAGQSIKAIAIVMTLCLFSIVLGLRVFYI